METAKRRCFRSSDCDAGQDRPGRSVCAHSTDTTSYVSLPSQFFRTLLHVICRHLVKISAGQQHDVLFMGDVAEIATFVKRVFTCWRVLIDFMCSAVEVSDFVPRSHLAPLRFPVDFAALLSYFVSVCPK